MSLVSGAVSWSLWTIFVHKAEAEALGISQALFGQTTLLGAPFTVIDPLMIGLPAAIIALAAGLAMEWKSDMASDAEAA